MPGFPTMISATRWLEPWQAAQSRRNMAGCTRTTPAHLGFIMADHNHHGVCYAPLAHAGTLARERWDLGPMSSAALV